MPNWKKVITSGSDASLNSLDVSLDITGSNALITNDLDVLGNVGIGTTSPTTPLHIDLGTVDVKAQLDAIGGFDGMLVDGTNASYNLIGGNGDKYTLGALNDGSFRIYNEGGAGYALTLNNSGKLGIGTTDPQEKLDIASGNIRLDDGFSIKWATTDANIGRVRIVGNEANDLLQFVTDNSEKMRLTNTGLGIGTTNPSQKLHVDGNARVTGAYYDSGNTPGTVNQVLASTATGTSWIDPGTITAEAASLVVIACKNTSGAAIPKGTPVYQTGNVGATATIEIAPADALISANKLPAIGVLQTDLNNNGLGNVVITGELTNFTTSPIDGVTPTVGDKIFVKSGGGLTLTKPTGEGNGIQNMGLVGKVSGGNAGSITVSSIMRTNDVPNLPEGKIWVGDGNTIVSDTVYIDEPNLRLGIGTTSPGSKLDVNVPLGTSDGITIDTNDEVYSIWSNSNLGGLALSANIVGYTTRYDLFLKHSNGNVGIGTTNPSQKLEVSGNIFATGNVIAYGGASDSSVLSALGTLQLRNSGNTNVNIQSTGNSYFNGGNVGIGTTSPGAKLEINSVDNIAAILNSSNTFTFLDFEKNGANRVQVGNASAGDFIVRTSDFERMRIHSNGNVGIGTTAPLEKLDVRGDMQMYNSYASGVEIKMNHVDPSTGYNSSIIKSVLDTIDAQDTGSSMLRFYTNDNSTTSSTVALDLTSESNAIFYGNVGIGTTTPSAKLDIEGDLQVKGVNISNQENLDVDTGTETIATVAIADYDAAFFDYVIKNGTDLRAGTVFAVHNGTSVEFTETSTSDLGNTSRVTLSVDISGADMRLRATATSDDWTVKSLVRAI